MANISEFYKRLREICEENNLTVNELAQTLGLSSGSPTAWKNGAVPRTATVEKIAAYFGVSVDRLLGSETEKAPTVTGERSLSDEDIMFALWGNTDDVNKDDLEDVRRYAAFVLERKKKK